MQEMEFRPAQDLRSVDSVAVHPTPPAAHTNRIGGQPAAALLQLAAKAGAGITGDFSLAPLRNLDTASAIRAPGDADARIAILASGRAYAARATRNGDRHVSLVHFPGDIVNYDRLFGGPSRYDICSRDARFLLIGAGDFRRALDASPEFAFGVARYENARQRFLIDRFCAAARSRARLRVLRALLELKAQQDLAVTSQGDALRLWLGQRALGDMIGLTPVYVSKTLAELEHDGLIVRERSTIRFPNRAKAEAVCGFVNYFKALCRQEVSNETAFQRQY